MKTETEPPLQSEHLWKDPAWDSLAALRESALQLLCSDAEARLLQSFSSWFFTDYLDRATGPSRRFHGSLVKARLRAAMLDLRHTARFLSLVAGDCRGEGSASELRLGSLADELAVAVERLATIIEEQISPRAAGGRARPSGRRP